MAKKRHKGNSPYVRAASGAVTAAPAPPGGTARAASPAGMPALAPAGPSPASAQADAAPRSVSQTVEQRRAAHAWATIQAAKETPGSEAFAQHAKKLPMRIRAAGLGQALVFVAAKGKIGTPNGHPGLAILLRHIDSWVLDERGLRGASQAGAPSALLEEIRQRDAMFLKRATAEAMGWLQWVNRFAEAEGLRSSDHDVAD